MEQLPSDLYNHNILIRLSIKKIYTFCLAGKTNYAYCEDAQFWRRYFKDMSHRRIQKKIKKATIKQLFAFIKFICENYEAVNILLDIRTLVYSYYYFAEQNNKYATSYIYTYIKNKYVGTSMPPEIVYKGNRFFSDYKDIFLNTNYGLKRCLPLDIHKKIKSLKTMAKLFVSISTNANKKDINHITTIYAKLHKELYPSYIAEYIVEHTEDINWINIININISTRHFDSLRNKIFGYLTYIGYDVSPVILSPTAGNITLSTFIENCKYDHYISIFGDKEIRSLQTYNLTFRSKNVYKIYRNVAQYRVRLLLDSYTILSPTETNTNT